MIRVFSFVASCAGEASRTLRYSDALAAVLTKKAEAIGESVSYRRMTGADLRIDYCRSCSSCFTKGFCPLDSVDDMPSLKRALLESDIILFGTPVYLSDLSGLAKCVIDRLSYWTHRFELAGKVGFAFAVTSNSFGPETAEHVKHFLTYTGLTMIRSAYATTTKGHPNLYLEQELQPELEAIADELLSAWRDPGAFVTPLMEAMLFSRNQLNQKARRLADLISGQPWNETLVCEARGIADYPSMKALVSERKGRSWDEGSEEQSDGNN